MKLILDRHDLRPEYFFRPAVEVDFRHFKKKTMEVIIASGEALFEHNDSSFITIKTNFPRRPDMIYKIARTEEEIDHQLNLTADAVESGTNLPGMSYEEGVQNAILWLMGDFDDPPIDDPAGATKSFVQTLTGNIRSGSSGKVK